MPGFKTSEKIRLPPQSVFDYVTDVSNSTRWLPGVVATEMLTEGPMAAGSRYRETRQAAERMGYVEIEVKEFDPPRKFVTGFDKGGYLTTYSYTFSAEGSGTKVEMECEVLADGWKMMMTPIVSGAMKRFDKRMLKGLKSVLEGRRRR